MMMSRPSGGFSGCARQGHDAVLDGYVEPVRIEQESVQDDLVVDFLADFLLRAAVDGQYVGPADDSDEVVGRVGPVPR